tara:strand:- start:802 stop:1017 length:216 start_codon:yes stop_codon:yes gene_type:complete
MIDWIKSHLVDDAKNAAKWFSMQSMGLVAAILGAWVAMPDDLKSALPEWLVPVVAIVVLALGAIGRLVKQK